LHNPIKASPKKDSKEKSMQGYDEKGGGKRFTGFNRRMGMAEKGRFHPKHQEGIGEEKEGIEFGHDSKLLGIKQIDIERGQ
jgi:hypothetical protein